ncbi:MAG: hypothetical protein ACREH3_15690, partial [Geminicoccales bacterium]
IEAVERCIKEPPFESRVFEIDPETAATLLLLHKPAHQRKLKAKLPRFVAAMRDEVWGLTGDTIKFGKSGDLIDGQNRLTACVKADVPFLTHVVFGVDDAAFALLDQGNIRSKEDVFRSRGAAFPNLTAKAVSWAEKLAKNAPGDRSVPEPYTLLRLYDEKYRGQIDPFVEMAIEASKAFPYPVGQLAAIFYHFHGIDEERFTEFFDAWFPGRGTPAARKVVEELHSRISAQKAEGFRVRDTQYAGWAMEAFATLLHPKRQRVRWQWTVQDDHYPALKAA